MSTFGVSESGALAALSIGARFNARYRILRRIKSGGMGAIYEVLHLETRRRRALKVMLPSLVSSSELRARFEREATIASGIRSEHIVETGIIYLTHLAP